MGVGGSGGVPEVVDADPRVRPEAARGHASVGMTSEAVFMPYEAGAAEG